MFAKIKKSVVVCAILSVVLCSCHQVTQTPSSDISVPVETDAGISSTMSKTATSITTLSTTTTATPLTTTVPLSTTRKTARNTAVKTSNISVSTHETTTTQIAGETFPTDPESGVYEVKIPQVSFRFDTTDYAMFYELIARYCGKTITNEFDAWCHKAAEHWDSEANEYVCTNYDLYFYTMINGCRSSEQFSFSFELKGDTYVCDEVWFVKPEYDSTKVKPPRKPTTKEEKKALKSERERVLEMTDSWNLGLTFVITDQEVEYHYDIAKDRNYFVVRTSYTDLEDEGWNSRERAEFEIER